jgi:DNA-directed RNA polymerase subunit M/transcription elongation factor TFIIS
MSGATFFLRECPTCGRRLQIRVEYLGRMVRCKHCEGRFEASDPTLTESSSDSGIDMLERANELLASLEPSRPRPR